MSVVAKVEIRVTRLDKYPRSLQRDLQSQQGHYFTGSNFQDAVSNAEKHFPNENLSTTLWKQWDDSGKLI